MLQGFEQEPRALVQPLPGKEAGLGGIGEGCVAHLRLEGAPGIVVICGIGRRYGILRWS